MPGKLAGLLLQISFCPKKKKHFKQKVIWSLNPFPSQVIIQNTLIYSFSGD